MRDVRIVMRTHGSTVPLCLDVDADEIQSVTRGAAYRNNGIVTMIDGTILPCANVDEVLENMMLDMEHES
jgi:hypothetical protein